MRFNIIKILCSIIFTFIATVITYPAWYTGWDYRREINIESSYIHGDLTNYPYLIVISNNTDISNNARSDGHDILFTLAGNTIKLAHEITHYTNGTLYAWVKIPFLSSTSNTNLYLYYGKLDATDQSDKTNVWDSYYRGVWHLDEESGSALDSTVYANTGTPVRSPAFGAAGAVNSCVDFTHDSSNYITMGDDAHLRITGEFTISCWVNMKSQPLENTYFYTFVGKGIVGKTDGYFGYSMAYFDPLGFPVKIYFERYGSTSNRSGIFPEYTLANNNWYYVVCSWDGTTSFESTYVRVNGLIVYTNSFPVTGVTSTPVCDFRIGDDSDLSGDENRTTDGRVDEVRVSAAFRSQDWIITEYSNQILKSNAIILGDEEQAIFLVDFISPSPGSVITAATQAFTGTAYDPSNTISAVYFSTDGNIWRKASGTESWSTNVVMIPLNKSTNIFHIMASNDIGKTVTNRQTNYIDIKFDFANWYNTDWTHRKNILLDPGMINGSLTNFPWLVYIDSDSDLASDAKSGGSDILFTGPDGKEKYAHEIESYNNSTGELYTWVKIPYLSKTSNTNIYMYYSNASASPQEDVVNTWDEDYELVMHMDESAAPVYDATSNNNDSYSTIGSPVFDTNGVINGCDYFHTNEYIRVNNIAEFNTSPFTVEFWFTTKYLPSEHTNQVFIQKYHTGSTPASWIIFASLYLPQIDKLQFQVWRSDGMEHADIFSDVPLDKNRLYHAAVRFDNDHVLTMFLDGEKQTNEVDYIAMFNANNDLFIGGQGPWQGAEDLMDEVRFSTTVRTSNWIATAHTNQRLAVSGIGASNGGEETPDDPTPPVCGVGSPAYGDIIDGNYTFTGSNIENESGILKTIIFITNTSTEITNIEADVTGNTWSAEWQTINAADGVYFAYVVSTNLSWYGTNSDPVMFIINNIDPFITETNLGQYRTNAGSVLFAGIASNAFSGIDPMKEILLKINAGLAYHPVTASGINWWTNIDTASGFSDGTNTFTFYAVNSNDRTNVVSITNIIDNSPPFGAVTNYVNGSIIAGGGVTIAGTNAENWSSLEDTYFFTNSVIYGSTGDSEWSFVIDPMEFENGANSLSIIVSNAVGLTYTNAWTIYVSNTVPTVYFASPTNGDPAPWVTESPLTITGYAESIYGAITNVSFRTNGDIAWHPLNTDPADLLSTNALSVSWWTNFSFIADSTNIIEVTVCNEYGFTSMNALTNRIDLSHPVLSFSNITHNSTLSNVTNIAGTAAESGIDIITELFLQITNTNIEYDYDIYPMLSGTSWETNIDTMLILNGYYDLVLYATNEAGLYTNVMVTNILISNVTGTLVIIEPNNGDYITDITMLTGYIAYGATPPINVYMSNTASGGWKEMNFPDKTNWYTNWYTSELSDGVHNLCFVFSNNTEYLGYSTRNVTVDNSIPAFGITNPTNDQVIYSTFDFTGTNIDPHSGIRGGVLYISNILGGVITNSIIVTEPTWQSTWDTSGISNGTFYAYLSITNKAGLYTNIQPVVFHVENREPLIEETNTPQSITLSGMHIFMGYASNRNSALDPPSVYYRTNAGSYVFLTNSVSWELLHNTADLYDEENTFTFMAVSVNGETNYYYQTNIVSNNLLGSMELYFLTNLGTYIRSNVIFSGTINEGGYNVSDVYMQTNDGLPWLISSGGATNWSTNYDTKELDDGEAAFIFYYTTDNGFTNSYTNKYTVDNTIPTVIITNTNRSFYNSLEITFLADDNYGINRIYFTKDNSLPLVGVTEDVPNGGSTTLYDSYIIQYIAEDLAGNYSTNNIEYFEMLPNDRRSKPKIAKIYPNAYDPDHGCCVIKMYKESLAEMKLLIIDMNGRIQKSIKDPSPNLYVSDFFFCGKDERNNKLKRGLYYVVPKISDEYRKDLIKKLIIDYE
ncbi:DUF2341 domain-containing protein [Spirochaetota bacterium]